MLAIANGIRSLSDFKPKTSELIARLKATGDPLVLTINGSAEVVEQDAEAYQQLLERVETIEYRSRPGFQIVPVDDQCSAILYPR